MSTQVKFKMHEGGFFSNFNKVITFLYEYERDEPDFPISQILWDLKGQPFGAFAYNIDNVFKSVFAEYGCGKTSFNRKVTVSEFTAKAFQTFTGKNAHDLYVSADQTWREKLNKQYKKFIIPGEVTQTYIDEIDNKKEFNGKLVSVLKRNQLLKCEQRNGLMPRIEKYFEEIDKIFDSDTYLYLCVDNINDLNSFIHRYKRCIYHPNMRRTGSDTDQEPHFIPHSERDAINTFVDLYSASKAQHFIHPVSNMATAALYFNPEMESIYIYE